VGADHLGDSDRRSHYWLARLEKQEQMVKGGRKQ
jgi:hypothetical protein